MKNLFLKYLGKILYSANRHANRMDGFLNDKHEFYEIKNKILARYGKADGYAVQFFSKKDCWGCDGTGEYVGWDESEWCYKCEGTGVYLPEKWVIHRRTVIGEHSFLTPIKAVFNQEEAEKFRDQENLFRGVVKQGKRKCDLDCYLLICGIYKPVQTLIDILEWPSLINESSGSKILKAITFVLLTWEGEKLAIEEEFNTRRDLPF